MALELSFNVVERNDNKLVTITDTTGIYHVVTNPTGWETGAATNPDVADIDGVTHTLELDVTLTISDGTETTYDSIDVYTLFGPFTDVGDLAFALDCSMLQVSSVAMGTSADEFPDGLYEITYTYDKGLASEVSYASTVLLDGRVANALYELLRTLPTDYECGSCHTKEILDIIFMKTYLDSIHASAYSARTTSILNQLGVLENLLTNVSSYTW